MYSTYNEGKSVVAKRLGPWQTKFNKIFTLHQILMLNRMKILMKKVSKFRVAIRVRISKQKNIFTKGYTENWSEEVFIITKISNTVPWT